jgi:anthranilate 1,2-dioxygenase small subunit
MEAMKLWFELHMLQDQYINNLDNDRLEAWPTLFTEDCLYEIIPKENADMGLPIGIIYCTTRRCCATAWCRCAMPISSRNTVTGT